MDKDRMDQEPLQDGEPTQKDTAPEGNQYRSDLYQDLPKEVVDILMQTHPLLAKGEVQQETDFSRTKRMSKEEREEIRAARRKMLEEEKVQQEEYVPRSQKNAPTQEIQQMEEETQEEEIAQQPREVAFHGNFNEEAAENEFVFQEPIIVTSVDEDDYEEDKVRFVKMKTPSKKKKIPRESQEKPKKKRRKKEDVEIYQDEEEFLDFQTKAKEEHLDQLYQEYDEGEEEFFTPRNLGDKKGYLIIGVVAFILVVLTIRSITLGSKLKKAEEELAKQVDVSQKYEELQLENLSLQEEIKVLKGEEVPTGDDLEEAPKTDDGKKTTGTAATGKYDTYTTKQNDTFWDIAQTVYGNGAYYTKILEANGMNENDYIQPGKELKIPKLAQ